ncbi:MAG: right-handed parallel beta-helix repeat-containing protein [Deltaproteobacteria bacterium]|nr:right-handed parallel beta-helix repeat-containing protein [Deltaproteobacteria bacterium]
MLRVVPLLVALLVLVTGCPREEEASVADSGVEATDAGPGSVDAAAALTCRSGYAPVGERCDPVLPAAACPPNSRPSLGSADCVPVGWTSCPQGFATAPSGWGCDSRLPTDLCAEASMEAIGSPSCVPVGDCSTPFPPSDATHYVDHSLGADQVDSTHFQTISAALSAAPAGAHIAVYPGTYAEGLAPKRNVKITGKCASQVRVDGSQLHAPGVSVPSAIRVEVSGLALLGHWYGASAIAKAQVILRDMLIEGAREAGVFLQGVGTRIDLEGSVIRGTVGEDGKNFGYGLSVNAGGTLTLLRSAVVANSRLGLYAAGARTRLELTDSVIRGTLPAPEAAVDGGELGIGLHLLDKAQVEIQRCLFADNRDMAINSWGATVRVANSVVRGTRSRPGGETGVGLSVLQAGTLELVSSLVSDNRSFGISVEALGSSVKVSDSVVEGTTSAGQWGTAGVHAADGAQVQLLRTAVVGNQGAALSAFEAGTTVSVEASLFRATTPDGKDAFGRGIDAEDAACLTVHDAAIVESTGIGLFLQTAAPLTPCEAVVSGLLVLDSSPTDTGRRARGVSVQRGLLRLEDSVLLSRWEVALFVNGEPSIVRVSRTLLRAQPDDPGVLGHLLVAHAPSEIHLTDCDVRDSPGAGLAFAGGSGVVVRGSLTDNVVALEALRGSSLVEVDAPSEQPPPFTIQISRETRFNNNGTMVGLGNLPLPEPL